jgi:hypothetical protein
MRSAQDIHNKHTDTTEQQNGASFHLTLGHQPDESGSEGDHSKKRQSKSAVVHK